MKYLITLLTTLIIITSCGQPAPQPVEKKSLYEIRKSELIAKRAAVHKAFRKRNATLHKENRKKNIALNRTIVLAKLTHGEQKYNTKYRSVLNSARDKIKNYYNYQLQQNVKWYQHYK